MQSARRALLLGICLLLPATGRGADEFPLPEPDPPRETLRYAVDFDGGSNAWGYELRLYTNRTVVYSGRGRVKTVGRRPFRISDEQYISLVNAFDYANFMRMRDPVGGDSNTALTLTYTSAGRSKTLRARDPAPTWPKPLFQLVWAMENVLQVNALACPTQMSVNKEAVDACDTRAKLMERYYPRK